MTFTEAAKLMKRVDTLLESIVTKKNAFSEQPGTLTPGSVEEE